jgi:hypothetical protein
MAPSGHFLGRFFFGLFALTKFGLVPDFRFVSAAAAGIFGQARHETNTTTRTSHIRARTPEDSVNPGNWADDQEHRADTKKAAEDEPPPSGLDVSSGLYSGRFR